MKKGLLIALCLLLGLPATSFAQDPGQVNLPLDDYNALVQAGEDHDAPAPAGYALSNATANVTVSENDGQRSAEVVVAMTVQALEEQWVLVPIVPTGTAVSAATVNGRQMQLVSTSEGLMWATESAGTYDMRITYQVDATRYDNGYSLSLPIPRAPSTELDASIPGTGLGVAVIPATAVVIEELSSSTQVEATIPRATGIQISWRSAAGEGLTMSRAVYRGQADDDAVTWTSEFGVELASDDPYTVELLSSSVALLGVQVDGENAPILVEGSSFAVSIHGRGEHTITTTFQIPIDRSQGSPRVILSVPRVPISTFELTLPGEKEVSVTPLSSVRHTIEEGQTRAEVNVPMTNQVTFGWLEAVPESEMVEEVSASAEIFHTVYAQEGVLYVHATTVFDVTRGEPSQFQLALPENIRIARIESPGGEIVNWRIQPEGDPTVMVFLDRQVSGEFLFDVYYERLPQSGEDGLNEVSIPLLSAIDVYRQTGMVALLASRELTLEPITEVSVTRVGENQLPSYIRDNIEMTIAHTFTYYETSPELTARAAEPEREQGRFDAQVDTLVSLGDVTTFSSVTIEINVKSGSLMALQLLLPLDVNFLNLSGPSLRSDEIETQDTNQVIDVEFTQELEGQFRIEVNYERITGDDDEDLPVPLLHVVGAEVEQGRVAIEALSAVEVQPSRTDNLSSVDISELPQQLILQTSNPILLAFKYVQADPRPELGLRITHHEEIDVQAAIIDQATYRTLYNTSGFVVTTASFIVRNSRQQFLRVTLPEGSEVWSATVNGVAETPALANQEGAEGPPQVLINIINSTQGFPVELIYATQLPELDFMGEISADMPRPDMVVTRTRWEMYLPSEFEYGAPETELNIIEEGVEVYAGDMNFSPTSGSGNVTDQPLQITVPAQGLRFSFEQLYANQTAEAMSVSIPFSSRSSAHLGVALSLVGTALIWLGFLGMRRRERRILMGALAVGGLTLLLLSVQLLDAGLCGPIWLSVVLVALTLVVVGVQRIQPALQKRSQQKQAAKARQQTQWPAPPPPPPPPLPVSTEEPGEDV